MHSSRREFLRMMGMAGVAGISSGGWLGIANAIARPDSDPSARFILIRVHGAMDSTLGLHPHVDSISGISPEDLFLGYSSQEILRAPGSRLTLGPAAAPVAQFMNQMAVVRGIYVGPNDLGHPFAMQHMTAGRSQESAPYWTSYFAEQFAVRGAYAVTNAALQRGNLPPFPTLLTSVLRSQATAAATGSQATGLSLYQDSSLGLNKFISFINDREKIGKFMEAYNASANAPKPSDENSSSSNQKSVSDADVIVASLYSGIARVAQLDLIDGRDGLNSIDTHVGHAENHLKGQQARWTIIAGLLGRLEELGLLNKTLVCVVTEFNRTPGLNASGGKDHNYSDNAVALFGRGVVGNAAIGDRKLYRRSDGFPYAYWAGSYLDYTTGATIDSVGRNDPPAGIDLIRPGDVWKTIAASFDEKLFKRAPQDSKAIPGLFA